MKRGISSLPFIFVLIDMLTKYLTVRFIPIMGWYQEYPYGGIPIFENLFGMNFSLNHVENEGAAWGLFAGYGDILLLFRLCVIGFLAIYLFFLKPKKEYYYPLLLIFSGAVGNVVDRFLYNHVVDMFHFTFLGYSFPVFNIADSLITIGALWFVVLSLLEKSPKAVKSR